MRPILIADCDEVLLEFAQPFVAYLDREHDLELRFDSFALSTNIRRKACGLPLEPAAFPPLLADFLAGHQHTQPAVAGAPEALTRIAVHADIVVLTNVEQADHGARADVLAALGMPYPIRCNSGGGKGRPVAELAAGRPSAVFVDDLPPNHGSVARHAPGVFRLHMVASPVLRPLIPAAPDAHVRLDDWADAEPWILARLAGEPL